MDIILSEAQEVGEKRNDVGEGPNDCGERSYDVWNLIIGCLCL